MLRRSTLLIALIAAFALPAAAAHAQSSPFAPLPQPAPQQDPSTATTSSSSTDDDGLESWQELLLFGGGIALLGGIAWLIVSDARRNAPAPEDTETQHESKLQREQDIKRRKERNRAAAKRSRAARKRNR